MSYLKYQSICTENLDHIQTEYNTFDWWRFLLGSINQLYRGIKSSYTTIKNPQVLLYFYLGKASTYGQIFQLCAEYATLKVIPMIIACRTAMTGPFAFAVTDEVNGNDSKSGTEKVYNLYNPYYILIHQPSKIEFSDDKADDFITFANDYGKLLDMIKTEICPKCPKTELQLGQKNSLAMLKPAEVEKDLKGASEYIEKKIKSLSPEAQDKYRKGFEIFSKHAQDGIKYLTDNLS